MSTGVLHSIRDALLFAKVESSYGVPGAFVPADDFIDEVEEITISASPIRTDRLAQQGSHGRRASINAYREVEVSFRIAIKGAGAPYAAAVLPPAHPLILACSFEHAVDTTASAEKVTYTPVSLGQSSVGLQIFKAGTRWDVFGCVGTLRMVGQVHQTTFFEFTLTGLFADPVSAALPVGFSSVDVVPPVMRGITITLDDGSTVFNPIISQYALDWAVQVGLAEDAAATNGLNCVRVVDRAPTLAINPLVDDGLVNFDPFAAVQASTPQDINLDIGSVQYNRYKIDIPQGTVSDAPYADRDGLEAYDLAIDVAKDESDDELILTFD